MPAMQQALNFGGLAKGKLDSYKRGATSRHLAVKGFFVSLRPAHKPPARCTDKDVKIKKIEK